MQLILISSVLNSIQNIKNTKNEQSYLYGTYQHFMRIIIFIDRWKLLVGVY